MFDAGPDPAVLPVVLAADDPAIRVVGGDRGDAAVAAVIKDLAIGAEQVHHGAAGVDDVIAVAGPADGRRPARGAGAADDDLGVDAAAVVVADGGDRLVVHGDRGA